MRANQGKVVSRPLAVFAVLAAVALVLWATLRQPNAAFTSEKPSGQIFSSSDVRTGRSDVYYTALTSAEVEALAPPGRVRINPPGRGSVSWDVVRAKLAERAQSITRQLDLIVWGDSITEHATGSSMGTPCCADVKAASEAAFKERGLDAALFGISGDQSDHLLYRLEQGEWPQQPPKVALVLIGTNDLGYARMMGASLVQAAVKGAAVNMAIAKWLLERSHGSTRVVLQLPLPRGASSHNESARTMDERLAQPSEYTAALGLLARHLLSFCERSDHVTCFDASTPFLDPQGGAILADTMPDALHPSAEGETAMDQMRAAYVSILLRTTG